jgi:ATP-binding cassette subfamily B protein
VRREKTLLDRWARIYSRFREVLSGIVTVRSFAREEEEKERFLRDVEGANQVVKRGVGIDSAVGGAQSLAAGLGRISVIAVGGFLVSTGQTTVGTVVAFLGYLGGLFGPVRGLSGVYTTFSRASASLDVVVGILDTQDSVTDAPNAVPLEGEVRGEVAFRRVRFRYPDGASWVLDEIDLEVSPGETVAIVGPSGAGKTTLMALLQRHLDPTEGSILLDGRDLRSLQQRSFRRQIGVVLQDALLFNDTLRNNISYGLPGASMAAIAAAAEAANAHGFISAMTAGYDTRIGESGGRLSMGERQRIAIARVLLKDPRIVILDEATSALDAETESLVQEALQALTRGRTTFVIAHRLSTVVSADRILVVRNGRIEETGDHETLLAAGGYYASLVRSQTRGLLPSTRPVGAPAG